MGIDWLELEDRLEQWAEGHYRGSLRCPVCLEFLTTPKSPRNLQNCQHVFCLECIKLLHNYQHNACPICGIICADCDFMEENLTFCADAANFADKIAKRLRMAAVNNARKIS